MSTSVARRHPEPVRGLTVAPLLIFFRRNDRPVECLGDPKGKGIEADSPPRVGEVMKIDDTLYRVDAVTRPYRVLASFRPRRGECWYCDVSVSPADVPTPCG